MVKFADEAFVIVSSGKGGNGCVAFRREKYVPMGGPSGGDGGRGGSIIFEIRRNLRTLAHVRYKQSFKAKTAETGRAVSDTARMAMTVSSPCLPDVFSRMPKPAM